MLLKQLQLSGRRWTQLWEYECNEFTERSLTVYAYDITESRAYERQLRLYHLTSFIFYSMEMRDTVRLHLCLVLLCLLLLRPLFHAKTVDSCSMAWASLVCCSTHEALVSSHTQQTLRHCSLAGEHIIQGT